MELGELRQQPHLSASGIGDYVECSLLYKFSRIDKLVLEYHTKADEPKRRQSDGLIECLQNAGYRIAAYTDVADTNRGMIYARRG